MKTTPLVTAALASIGLLSGIASLPQTPLPAPANPQDTAFFENRVRPLLLEKCASCHGSASQLGGLRLDSRAGLLQGGSDGAVVVGGAPDASALIQAIRYDGKRKMPPSGKLSADEIAALTAWVQQGANWPAERGQAASATSSTKYVIPEAKRNFWSFRPIQKPAMPPVQQQTWVRNPIDRFILARLEQKGLKPAIAADKRMLIRRATFDLIGLPPTPAEVDAFLADTAKDAFAKVVDRLLASPHYGERWGRHWLDVVRYCDSLDARGLGSEGDIREAWRYRDWVVKAFNSDMPYNLFMENQVAGDLLPTTPPGDFNRDGTIATGMLAIGNWGNGDADKEKIMTDIADDQVDVVSRGFLGLTVGCARCHDHKFDPISTKDYYGLAGIFMSTHILPKMAPKGAGESPLHIPLITKADQQRRDAFAASLTRLDETEDALRKALATRLLPDTTRYLTAAWDYAHRSDAQSALTLTDFAAQKGLATFALRQWIDTLGLGDYRLMTTPARDIGGISGIVAWKSTGDTPSATINTTAVEHKILTFTLPAHSVSVHPSPTNGVVAAWKSPVNGTFRVSGRVADADPACGDGIAWILDHRSVVGARELASGDFPNGGMQDFAQGKGAEHLALVSVKAGDEIQVLVLPKGDYSCDTTVVQLTLTQQETGRTWDLTQDLMADPLQDGKGNPHADHYGNAGIWRFYDMADSDRARTTPANADPALRAWREAATTGDHAAIERAALAFQNSLAIPDTKSPFWLRQPGDIATLSASDREGFTRLAAERDTLQKQAPPPIEYAVGAQEGGVPESSQAGIHDIHVHIRGSYLRLGDLVPRHFPVVLAGDTQPPITSGSGRLELARWLASDNQKLTPRVIINRIWQHHFGEGIVRTPSNFGFMGERPTHPELLDWLASRFVADGWSMKRLHRLIMLSAAYQQSSIPDPGTLKVDPDNRLFGRMNRRRLESEAIRDSLLAASGSLDTTMGGPANRDFQTPRRSLYIMTIRSDRSGFGPLFDVADSTASMDHRVVSTIAPQALFLLNNPFALEQTTGLAKRLLALKVTDDRSRIAQAYLLLYSRPATEIEIKIGRSFLERMRRMPVTPTATPPSPKTASYEPARHPNDAMSAVPSPAELRAWEAYCQILLCANEFLYVD